MLSIRYLFFALQCVQANDLSLFEPTSCCFRGSSNVDTLRLIVPLCWLPAALISVWVLGEHDIVERAEMTVCVREGVNSIPTVEMAFKCISLCTRTALQTHYLGASVCVSTNSCVRVCVATNVFPSQSSNHLQAPTRLYPLLFRSFSHSSCFPS